MRVAIVAECFTPTWNGVTNSVVRSVEHLERAGHTVLVVAPAPGPVWHGATPVVRVPGLSLAPVLSVPIGLPCGLLRVLDRFGPEVAHLAAPVVLGEAAGRACRRLGVPAVASYQTDLAGFVRRYRLGLDSGAVWGWLQRAHRHAAQEALACGVPVVAPASGGLLDLVTHGCSGWLYPAHRPEVLRQAVAALVGDPGQRAAMGAAAHESVQSRTWSAVGDQLIGHYRSVQPVVAVRLPARRAA